MFHLVNNHQSGDIHNYLEGFLKNKTPDCIIYSEDGAEFKTHKELFCQTQFMRELLKSQSCCGLMEVIFPCSNEELGHLVNFLNEGKIEYNKKRDSLKIIENLNKILGFPSDYIDNIIPVPRPATLDETENNGVEVEILPKTSNLNSETGKNAASKAHLELKSYKCKECNKSFQKNSRLEKHMEGAHLKPKPYQCFDCLDSFSSKHECKIHKAEVHQKFRSFKCNECMMSFQKKIKLEKHILKMHPPVKTLGMKQKNQGEENLDTSNSTTQVQKRSLRSNTNLQTEMNAALDEIENNDIVNVS